MGVPEMQSPKWWRSEVKALFGRFVALLGQATDEIDLDPHAISPLVQYDGSDGTPIHSLHNLIIDAAQIVPVFPRPIRWRQSIEPADGIDRCYLRFATYKRTNDCTLVVRVDSLDRDGQPSATVAEAAIEAAPLEDNQYAEFRFAEMLPAGTYRFSLYAERATGHNAVAVYVAPRKSGAGVRRSGADDGVPTRGYPAAHHFQRWYEKHRCTEDRLEIQSREQAGWETRPLFAVILSAGRTEAVRAVLDSLRAQSYSFWECFVAVEPDDPGTAEDERVKVVAVSADAQAPADWRAVLSGCRADYVAVLDSRTTLEPDALFECARAIVERRPGALYGDEVRIGMDGSIQHIRFLPHFERFFFLTHVYLPRLLLVRRDWFDTVGLDPREPVASWPYRLLFPHLKTTSEIHHLPRLLSRRTLEPDESPEGCSEPEHAACRSALVDGLRATDGTQGRVEDGPRPGYFRVRFPIKPVRISAIVPTRDRVDLLRTCVETVEGKTFFPPGVELEFIVIDNGSTEEETHAFFGEMRDRGHQVVRDEGPFNFARLNNLGAGVASGDLLLFLNNDIEITEPGWLEALLEPMADSQVGIVGAKLLYPGIGLVQHAGVLMGFNGVADHYYQFFPEFEAGGRLHEGYIGGLLSMREYLALTAACLLVRRSDFDAVGGMDINLEVGFPDTDLCLRVWRTGKKCVYTPYARLVHHESASRGTQSVDPHPIDTALFWRRWRAVIEAGDPSYNPNLLGHGEMFHPR